MITETHIWKTNDGRYITDGNDTSAVLLAYAAGDEVPDAVMDEITGKPAKKAASKPADKSVSKPNDK